MDNGHVITYCLLGSKFEKYLILCVKIRAFWTVKTFIELKLEIIPLHLFKYRNDLIPPHTKSSFNSMKVLTVLNVIAKNALFFMHKIRYFLNLLPKSVIETIPSNAPNNAPYPWLNIS